MKIITTVLSCLLLASFGHAQQELRGKVEDVRNTVGQFVLDGTRIPLVSSALNLNLLIGQQVVMQVNDIGVGGTVLEVLSAVPTAKILDMGNLRFGRAERWEVNGMPGSRAWVFVTGTDATSYTPLGQLGTWLLGAFSLPVANGVINGLGQYEFRFTIPNLPSLKGVEFTSQAVVQEVGGKLILSNPDSKKVRN